MTPTNEDLLALADRADSWNRCYPGNLNVEVLVRDLSAALRALTAERQALAVNETPESDHQRDLVTADERQAIRDKALEDAAMCCEAEADKCDDAVKWGGAPKYIANCKAASYAMRDRAYAIRAMKGKPE